MIIFAILTFAIGSPAQQGGPASSYLLASQFYTKGTMLPASVVKSTIKAQYLEIARAVSLKAREDWRVIPPPPGFKNKKGIFLHAIKMGNLSHVIVTNQNKFTSDLHNLITNLNTLLVTLSNKKKIDLTTVSEDLELADKKNKIPNITGEVSSKLVEVFAVCQEVTKLSEQNFQLMLERHQKLQTELTQKADDLENVSRQFYEKANEQKWRWWCASWGFGS